MSKIINKYKVRVLRKLYAVMDIEANTVAEAEKKALEVALEMNDEDYDYDPVNTLVDYVIRENDTFNDIINQQKRKGGINDR